MCQDLQTHLHSFHQFKSSSVVMCKPPRIPLAIKKRALLFLCRIEEQWVSRFQNIKFGFHSSRAWGAGGRGTLQMRLIGIHVKHAYASLEDLFWFQFQISIIRRFFFLIEFVNIRATDPMLIPVLSHTPENEISLLTLRVLVYRQNCWPKPS